MRGLASLAVRRRVSVLMTALAVVAFGVVGYQRLSVELLPDVTYPSITIQTELPDTAPQEIETMITRPVEEAVGVLKGLVRIHSVSRPGVSLVSLEFAWGSNMGALSMDVREKLDRIVFPDGTEDPIVLRYDPSLEPILRLGLVGPDELTTVRVIAEKKLEPDFETVPGVASAQLSGGLEEEIRIEVDQERLAALGLGLDAVQTAIGASNVNLPGGALRGRDNQFLIRTMNELDTVEEIAGLIVREQDGRQVTVGDIARVFRGFREREEITRVDGRECVQISIFKEGDGNTVTVARALQERIDTWRKKLPPGYELVVLFDQSKFIVEAVEEVRTAAVLGGVIAIFVLLLFLRDVRSTLIVATAIPLSIVATFLAMYRLEISLNVMSLGGLTLGIGMLVDNAIVVLEAIFRRRNAGASLTEAAVEGTAEVGAAVVASTLTTIAVFLPIVFVEGVAGELFEDQALTVTMSLLASLVVAVTVIPMLSAIGWERTKSPPKKEETKAETLGFASRAYDALVRAAIRRRFLTLGVAAALFAGAVNVAQSLETELIPPLTSGEFFYELEMPEGTSLAATDRVVKQMESAARSDERIRLAHGTAGSRTAPGGMSLETKAEHFGELHLSVVEGADEVDVAERLRARLADLPDAKVRFGRPSYFSLETPIEVAVFGDDLVMLRRHSLQLAEKMRRIDGLVDVRSSLEAGNPELQVIFDRERVAGLGLDLGVLSETLRARIQGVVPTRFKEGDRQIDIRILNEERARASIEDVRRLVLPGPDGQPIRLLSVADVEPARGPAQIHRLQQQRAALITANLAGVSLGDAVTAVEAVLEAEANPSGVATEIGGQNREMQTSFASLRFAVALAIFLVYLVMASTFESLLHPFVVLFTIPLALIGVVLGLVLTGTTITVIVLIGLIVLVGIVVNNAIVLIDAINRFRREGEELVEAVVRAGHVRLRPILMTTFTTTLAMIPMALGFGEGAELRAPLAVTVASGLLLSTFLTLVVIPATYVLAAVTFDRGK